MADTNLDIILNMVAKGDGAKITQAQLQAVTEAANEGSKDAIALQQRLTAEQQKGPAAVAPLVAAQKTLAEAMADVREESERAVKFRESGQTIRDTATKGAADEAARRATVLRELKEAQEKLTPVQEEETKKTEDATVAKKQMLDAARGLQSQFPGLASVIRLASSEESILAGSIALGIHAFYSYIDILSEAEKEQAALAGSARELGQAILTSLNMQAQAEAATRSYAKIKDSVNSVETALTNLNEKIVLNHQLAADLRDLKLEEAIQKVDDDHTLTPAQKIRAKAKLVSNAETEKNAAGIGKLELEADALRQAQINAAGDRDDAALKLASNTESLQKARDIEKTRTTDKEKVKEAAEPQLAKTKADKDLLERVMGGAAGYGELIKAGFEGLPDNPARQAQVLEQLNAQIEHFTKVITDSAVLAEQSKNRREALEAEHTTLIETRNKNETARQSAELAEEKKRTELRKRVAFLGEAAPIRERINQAKTDAAANAAAAAGRAADEAGIKEAEAIFGPTKFGPDGQPLVPKRTLPNGRKVPINYPDWSPEQLRQIQQSYPGRSDPPDGTIIPPGRSPKPDLGALRDVNESTSDLTASIEGFAAKSTSLHQSTASRLDRLTQAIEDVAERQNQSRIA